MASTTAGRWEWLKNRFRVIPLFVRRLHRVVGAVWILSFALAYAVPAVTELPGPSIPGLSFITLILTGTYLLVRPWIREERGVSNRLNRLTNRDVSRPVLVRRAHRALATLLLLFIGVAIALQVVAGTESPFVLLPIAGLLLVLAISGIYMLLRPWVSRFRAR